MECDGVLAGRAVSEGDRVRWERSRGFALCKGEIWGYFPGLFCFVLFSNIPFHVKSFLTSPVLKHPARCGEDLGGVM